MNKFSENKNHSILVVDQCRETFGNIQEATEDLGVRFFWGSTADEALELLRHINISIVIANTNVRTSDGAAFVEEIKSRPEWQNIYTVVLVDAQELKEHMLALESGVDDFMLKPVEPFLLRTRIVAGLRMRALLEEKQRLENRETYLATVVTVGHKINNPLCSILGNAVLLRDEIEQTGLLDENKHIAEHLDTIENQAERIADFVRQLQEQKDPQFKEYLGQMQMVDLPEDSSAKTNRE